MKPSEQLPDQSPENKVLPRRAFLAASAALGIATVLGCRDNDPNGAYYEQVGAKKMAFREKLQSLRASRDAIVNGSDSDDIKRKSLEALLAEVQSVQIDPSEDMNYYGEHQKQSVLVEDIQRDIDSF